LTDRFSNIILIPLPVIQRFELIKAVHYCA
jgi:hypothetical protein